MNKKVVKQQQKQQLKQQQEKQQFSYPSTFDMEGIRLARKDNALRFLDETLPAMITRLRNLNRRSKAAADEGLCADWKGSKATFGPSTAAKKRTFPGRLNEPANSAKDLLQQHSELVGETNQRVIKKKMRSNSKLLLKLTDDAEYLWKTHQIIHHENTQDEEDSQRKSIEEARLILAHPVFKDIMPEEEPMEREEEDEMEEEEMEEEMEEEEEEEEEEDEDTPIANTLDLINLVAAEMRKVI